MCLAQSVDEKYAEFAQFKNRAKEMVQLLADAGIDIRFPSSRTNRHTIKVGRNLAWELFWNQLEYERKTLVAWRLANYNACVHAPSKGWGNIVAKADFRDLYTNKKFASQSTVWGFKLHN